MVSTPSKNKLRVMVDANIVIAGIGWSRFPFEVLQHALRGDFQLVLSPFIIAEARAHLGRLFPDFLPHFEALISSESLKLVPDPDPEDVAANAALVRDPKDVPVALAAINGVVDYLVTQDRDFTDRDESTAALHQRLNILLPGTFLREHMGWTSEALEAIRMRNWQDIED